jgi:hypothetical protein
VAGLDHFFTIAATANTTPHVARQGRRSPIWMSALSGDERVLRVVGHRTQVTVE